MYTIQTFRNYGLVNKVLMLELGNNNLLAVQQLIQSPEKWYCDDPGCEEVS